MRKKLKTMRENAGYSQRTFAKAIGVSRCHYCQIEGGKRNPSIETWFRIKQVLSYPSDDIFFAA